MKCHPCVNTRQNNPFSGSGCTNFRNSTLVRHQKTSAHIDALKGLKLQSDMKKSMKKAEHEQIQLQKSSLSCKRSVCDPLKLKMTPKVNYLGVTMTPENFFEGKTLNCRSRVASMIPARSHTFVEIDREIISTVILLPSADSFKKGCCQLQAKVCAQITG